MKRASLFLVLAVFILLVIQPNLSSGSNPDAVRVPEYNDQQVITNEDASKVLCQSKSVIVLDPGKTASDPGYIGSNNISEKDLCMQMALAIGESLSQAGYEVKYTRMYDDTSMLNPDLSDEEARLEYARDNGANYLVSIRFNTGDSLDKGFSILTQPNNETLSALSSSLVSSIQATNYSSYLGTDTDHYANFPVLSDMNVPAILVQMGYLSNSEDYAKISDPAFQQKLAAAFTQSFLNTIN